MLHTRQLPGEVRGRKRNNKKNRSQWARTSNLRRRPITGADFEDLKKGRFDWSRRHS